MWIVGERENKTGEFYEEMGGNRTMEKQQKKDHRDVAGNLFVCLSAMP